MLEVGIRENYETNLEGAHAVPCKHGLEPTRHYVNNLDVFGVFVEVQSLQIQCSKVHSISAVRVKHITSRYN